MNHWIPEFSRVHRLDEDYDWRVTSSALSTFCTVCSQVIQSCLGFYNRANLLSMLEKYYDYRIPTDSGKLRRVSSQRKMRIEIYIKRSRDIAAQFRRG